jgi:hypothetical protein
VVDVAIEVCTSIEQEKRLRFLGLSKRVHPRGGSRTIRRKKRINDWETIVIKY